MTNLPFHLKSRIHVNKVLYQLCPVTLTNDEYQDMYQAFLEFIRLWQSQITQDIVNPEINYSDILMWIEFINWSNIYTDEFIHTLDQVYQDEEQQSTNHIELFTEFYGSLFLNFHPELLDILEGRTYHMLQSIYHIDMSMLHDVTDLTVYPWRWLIPYYNIAVPLDRKQGLMRMMHLNKLAK
jgi:hypothetical protein